MNRFWIGVAALAAALAISLGLWAFTGNLTETLTQELLRGEALAEQGSWQQARACTDRFREKWDGSRDFLLAFTAHAPLEEADILLDQLEIHGGRENDPEFSLTSCRIRHVLAAVAEAHSLRWWNFL